MSEEQIMVDGRTLVVRPIEIVDAERLRRLFQRLSPDSVHSRFFSPLRDLPRTAFLRLADVDHRRRDALVALDGDEIVAVARYDAGPRAGRAEIAVTVEDAWQHRGLGRRLAVRLAKRASAHGYEELVATMLPDNRAALKLVRSLSPGADIHFDRGTYEAIVPLSRAS